MESLKQTKEDIKYNEKEWRESRDAWKAFQKAPPKRKRAPKNRAEEIREEMRPMEMELAMEDFAVQVDMLRRKKTRLTRDLNKEKTFTI